MVYNKYCFRKEGKHIGESKRNPAAAGNQSRVRTAQQTRRQNKTKMKKNYNNLPWATSKKTIYNHIYRQKVKKPVKTKPRKNWREHTGWNVHDTLLQTAISILKKFDEEKLKKLPTVWQRRFREFSLDKNDFVYVDERLIVPEGLRKPIFRSLHWGHPGRDAILQVVGNIWWPKIHRDVLLLAQSCSQCQLANKTFKTLIPQSKLRKLSAAEHHNNEQALDFAGPFNSAPEKETYLSVAIDYETSRPNATFVITPTAERTIYFMHEHISHFGIPRCATIFRDEKMKNFAGNSLLNTSIVRLATTAEMEILNV